MHHLLLESHQNSQLVLVEPHQNHNHLVLVEPQQNHNHRLRFLDHLALSCQWCKPYLGLTLGGVVLRPPLM